jgi:DNA-directed RNA polymerase specialized sigma24 family protein
MNFQSLHHLYSERLPEIEKIIDMESDGNADLRQEGLLGAYQALQTDPHATKRFLLNKATWEMVSSVRKGKSVDNGFYKRKNLKITHCDHLPFEDGLFAEALSSDGKEPVDEQAIFRISLQRLFHGLSDNETRYIRHKTMDGMSDVSIRKRLRITFTQIYEIKRNIRRQIELAFAASPRRGVP